MECNSIQMFSKLKPQRGFNFNLRILNDSVLKFSCAKIRQVCKTSLSWFFQKLNSKPLSALFFSNTKRIKKSKLLCHFAIANRLAKFKLYVFRSFVVWIQSQKLFVLVVCCRFGADGKSHSVSQISPLIAERHKQNFSNVWNFEVAALTNEINSTQIQ